MTEPLITLADATERNRALNPGESFIVQAPAGSGKTELLTQRFLVLLNTVDQPEEILAITFTKKSATEMRSRILRTLQNAKSIEPTSPYQLKTWQFARNVLARDEQLQWHLLENPGRLNIQTIDAFHSTLIGQHPIVSTIGSSSKIAEDPRALYQQATQRFLLNFHNNPRDLSAMIPILRHLDHDLRKVADLLIHLLQKRDQWQPLLTECNTTVLRQMLEENLSNVNRDILKTLAELFPPLIKNEVLTLARFAATHLQAVNHHSPLAQCQDLLVFPGDLLSDKPRWLGLAELFLTKQGDWRKRYDKTVGFPSPANSASFQEKTEWADHKKRISDIIEGLRDHIQLKNAFLELIISPDHQYPENQWVVLHALIHVLQRVYEELRLCFSASQKIDFIENAHAALQVLTHTTTAYRHILIDEFQDTSTNQYRLLKQMIKTWKPGDGRTLFLVGDPMQSIYRFREAEVGLFIKTQQSGIEGFPLTALKLSVNFRSRSGIIDWINHHFSHAFPSSDHGASGAVTYSPSTSLPHPKTAENSVTYHPLLNATAQEHATHILNTIQHIQTHSPGESIALLVRSRSHLKEIIKLLKEKNVAYHAMGIDALFTSPVIQDLLSLTRALRHPGDRIAWLSILRAPWCGLRLADLVTLVDHEKHEILWYQMQSATIQKSLTPDGFNRLQRLIRILKSHENERHFYRRVKKIWLGLGGPATVQQENHLRDAETFFTCLEKLALDNPVWTVDDLTHCIDQLYAAPDMTQPASLQLMTIHSSKGLEFDHVILPHLERKIQSDDNALLRWIERPCKTDSALLIAPLHAIGQENDTLYQYIKHQESIKAEYESTRLFYVAATRAKKRLYLFFTLEAKDSHAFVDIQFPSQSFIQKIEKTIRPELNAALFGQTLSNTPDSQASPPCKAPALIRLTSDWQPPTLLHNETLHLQKRSIVFQDSTARLTGIVIHQILQYLGDTGITAWETSIREQQKKWIESRLHQAGVSAAQRPNALEKVITAIDNTLSDAYGRWILSPHANAQNEYRLTGLLNKTVHSIIMDRTWVDEQGTRWIIDYKTATPDDDMPLELFIKMQKQMYLPILKRYAALIQQFEQTPVHAGLYYPLMPLWVPMMITQTVEQ